MNSPANVPLFLIVAIVCLVMGSVVLLQIMTQQDIFYVDKYVLGYDYLNVYNASVLVRQGASPYGNARYVVPPVPAVLDVPLSLLPFDVARVVIAVLLFSSVFASVFLIHHLFPLPDRQNRLLLYLGTLIIMCFSYPVFFLVDRGNVDGFALLLMCLGVYCLAGGRGILAGVLFALAVSFKVYPIITILPLVAFRRWRTPTSMGLTLLLLFLLMPHAWLEFAQQRLAMRTTLFRLDENASVMSTFFYMGALFGQGQLFIALSYFAYLALLAALFHCDCRRRTADNRQLCASVLMYLPFMVAVPALSYHYQLVLLLAMIPLVSWLWIHASESGQQKFLLLIVYGIGLSQFQAVAVAKLTGSVAVHFVPGFGLLLVMIGAVAYRFHELRRNTRLAPAAQA